MRLILPQPVDVSPVESEQERLEALGAYAVLDTPAEEGFDRLTRLTTRIFDVPMSTIALIDAHRQWFKSQQGIPACETARDDAICNVTIQHDQPLILSDASKDPRFADNPYVRGDPHIRFYAGTPLRSPEGHAVGTLCALDSRPRPFSEREAAILSDLGGMAVALLEMHKRLRETQSGGRSDSESETLKAGQLHFNRGMVRCTVRSLSPQGATVGVSDAAAIPNRVAFVVDLEGISRLCWVTARSERRLELTFES